MGVSELVACTVASDPNLTKAKEGVVLVMSKDSPPFANCTFAETVLDARVTVAVG